MRIVAVFPPGTTDLTNYLEEHGISGIEIKYSELSQIDVNATPTIIITDETGKIVRSWVGTLSSDEEMEIANFLNS